MFRSNRALELAKRAFDYTWVERFRIRRCWGSTAEREAVDLRYFAGRWGSSHGSSATRADTVEEYGRELRMQMLYSIIQLHRRHLVVHNSIYRNSIFPESVRSGNIFRLRNVNLRKLSSNCVKAIGSIRSQIRGHQITVGFASLLLHPGNVATPKSLPGDEIR